MKRFGIFLLLSAPMLAERPAEELMVKDWTDCRLKDFYPSSCIGLYHHYTIEDGIAAFLGYRSYDAYVAAKWKYLAEQGRTLYQNAKREADELRAEVKRLRESTAAANYPPPVAAPMPAYAPEMFEPSAPDSFQHPANKTRQRSTERQSGPYTERSTRLPGGTIQTLTSDGRQCYTEKLAGGELYTYCY